MENITLSLEDRIAILTINRPKALNALNTATMKDLHHFFTVELKANDEIRGVIITGAGEKAFVAGADISEFLSLGDEGGKNMATYGHSVFNAIENAEVPVVAAVNGFALGGGCELAMACHLRIAGAHARFGQPEVNLGIIPGYGGTQRLVDYIGRTKAMELLMTADMIDANTAQSLGLVNKVVDSGSEVEAAKELLGKILAKAPIAITEIINTVNAHKDKTKDGYAQEIESFGRVTLTEDFKEGASAFLEKRKANFTGK